MVEDLAVMLVDVVVVVVLVVSTTFCGAFVMTFFIGLEVDVVVVEVLPLLVSSTTDGLD